MLEYWIAFEDPPPAEGAVPVIPSQDSSQAVGVLSSYAPAPFPPTPWSNLIAPLSPISIVKDDDVTLAVSLNALKYVTVIPFTSPEPVKLMLFCIPRPLPVS